MQPSFLPFGVLVVGTPVCCAPVLRVPPASPGRASSARSPTPQQPARFTGNTAPASRSSALSGEPHIGYFSLKGIGGGPRSSGVAVVLAPPSRRSSTTPRSWRRHTNPAVRARSSAVHAPARSARPVFRGTRCNAARVTANAYHSPRLPYTAQLPVLTKLASAPAGRYLSCAASRRR